MLGNLCIWVISSYRYCLKVRSKKTRKTGNRTGPQPIWTGPRLRSKPSGEWSSCRSMVFEWDKRPVKDWLQPVATGFTMGGPFWRKYATPIFAQNNGVVFMYIFHIKCWTCCTMDGPFGANMLPPIFAQKRGCFYVYFSYKMLKNPLCFRFFMQKLQENNPIMAQKWGGSIFAPKMGSRICKKLYVIYG